MGLNSTAFIQKSHFNNKNYWLIKAIDLNRGRCIKISNKCDDIKQIIQTFSEGISRGIESEEIEEDKKYKEILSPIKEKIYRNRNKSGEFAIKKDETNLQKNLNSIKLSNKTAQNFNLNLVKNQNEANLNTNYKINKENCNAANKNEDDEGLEIIDENVNKENNKNEEDSQENIKKKKNILKKYKANCVLIQKYIEKPLLYYGRKFDIRMWILIDHKNNVYIFK